MKRFFFMILVSCFIVTSCASLYEYLSSNNYNNVGYIGDPNIPTDQRVHITLDKDVQIYAIDGVSKKIVSELTGAKMQIQLPAGEHLLSLFYLRREPNSRRESWPVELRVDLIAGKRYFIKNNTEKGPRFILTEVQEEK